MDDRRGWKRIYGLYVRLDSGLLVVKIFWCIIFGLVFFFFFKKRNIDLKNIWLKSMDMFICLEYIVYKILDSKL